VPFIAVSVEVATTKQLANIAELEADYTKNAIKFTSEISPGFVP
jgi:hypothetical protein